ncbi:hypothetical protein WJX79_000294 [Trebouxia sp. C0005]
MDQLTQHIQQQGDLLQSQFDTKLLAQAQAYDKKLDTQAERQNRISAFVCKPVLLRLASDILSLTLSAVRPDARAHDKSDIWSMPLQQHKKFASSLSRLCTKMNCPLGASTMASGFNKIRFDNNDELHEDHWVSLLKQAHDYADLEYHVPANELAEWIVFHAEDFKSIYDKHCTRL